MKRIFTILFMFTLFFGHSQVNDSIHKDLKVGLVLSGGGAKGLSHIAVLKALEDSNVRIDYIGGTSMGAVVGGLYAAGYSAHEIDSIIRDTDFTEIMKDETPRKSKSFFEKENGEKHALILPFKKGKLTLPRAISKGQNISNKLTQLMEPVDTISDFSKLPIPFLCIATDIETGEKVVLKHGNLPQAIQASGAFPTLLEPIEIDGKLLVDGGLVDNFPVEEIKSTGVDVIIGVELKNDYADRDDLNSALDIVNQIVNFKIFESYDEKILATDVLVAPNLEGFEVTSFDKYEEILKMSTLELEEHIETFKSISQRQIQKPQPIDRPVLKSHFYFDEIKIRGNKDYTRGYVKSKLRINEHDSISRSDLVEGINNLSATGNFTSIHYNFSSIDNQNILNLNLKQNDIYTYLKLAVHYDDLYKSALLVNITSKHLISKNDVISLDVILGDNIRYNFDYFIDNESALSFGFKSRYNKFYTNANLSFDVNPNSIDLNYRDFTNQFYIQKILNQKFALAVGLEHKHISSFTETSVVQTLRVENGKEYFDKSDYLNATSFFKFDSYDKKYFQKKGFYLAADFRWFILSSDFNDNFNSFSQLDGSLGYAYTFFDKLTLHLISEAGITIGDNQTQILDFHLGGYGENYINTFRTFYGYEFASLTGSGFLRTSLHVRYEVFKKNYLMPMINVARVSDDIINDGDLFQDTKLGVGMGYGIDTILGPIELNYSYSPDTHNSFVYFNLGYWF